MTNNLTANPYLIGFLPDPVYYVYSQAMTLNAANTWGAISFVAAETDVLFSVQRQIDTVTGTLGVNDLTCTLYSDSAGLPSAILQVANDTASAPTASEWLEFIGFTYTLTAGTRYWLVFKNVNASPASNYPTFKSAIGAMSYAQYLNDINYGQWGHVSASTTNAGSSWSVSTAGEVGTCRIKFGNGTLIGLGVQSNSLGTEAEDFVYGVREVGAKFTTPKGPVLNVAGITLPILKHGSPSVNPYVKLYVNDVLVVTSLAVPSTNIPTDALDYTFFMLPANLLVQPGSNLRVVLAEPTNSDSSSNYYALPHLEVENVDAVLELKPFSATLQHCLWDGYEWTDTAASIVPFGLVLDTTAPFSEELEIPEANFDFSEAGNSQYLALI